MTATFLVARCKCDLNELAPLTDYYDDIEEITHLQDQWQVAFAPTDYLVRSADKLVVALARATNAPALSVFVENTDVIVIDICSEGRTAWSACLPVRARPESGRAEFGVDAQPQIILTARDIAERMCAWACAAGLGPNQDTVQEVLESTDTLGVADEVVDDLLAALGFHAQ